MDNVPLLLRSSIISSPYAIFNCYRRALSKMRGYDFVEVHGGSRPQSDPCEALSYHGFLGMEDQGIQVITDWLSGKNVASKIGQ